MVPTQLSGARNLWGSKLFRAACILMGALVVLYAYTCFALPQLEKTMVSNSSGAYGGGQGAEQFVVLLPQAEGEPGAWQLQNYKPSELWVGGTLEATGDPMLYRLVLADKTQFGVMHIVSAAPAGLSSTIQVVTPERDFTLTKGDSEAIFHDSTQSDDSTETYTKASNVADALNLMGIKR